MLVLNNMEHATQSALSKSSLTILPISERDLATINGGLNTPGGGSTKDNTFSFWDTIGKPFLTKASENAGGGFGNILWLVPTLVITEVIKWHINKKIKKYEKRRKREKLERRKANLANAD